MFQSRMIGEVKVTRVLEYFGPTHAPEYLFPEFDRAVFEAHRSWLVPNHWVPAMDRLIIAIQVWVVQAGTNVIVIDPGVGNFKNRLPVARMHMLNTLFLPWFEAGVMPPGKVTHVVSTHLHTDHIGWNTMLQDGRWVPTFPNAKYFIPRDDFTYFKEAASKGTNAAATAAFEDSIMPVLDAGLVQFFSQHDLIADCLQAEPAPGHTPGQVAFRLSSRGEEAIFCGDVCHHPLQIIRPDWNSRFCIAPDDARATRLALLASAAKRETLFIPAHFAAPHCGHIRCQGNGYQFIPASW